MGSRGRQHIFATDTLRIRLLLVACIGLLLAVGPLLGCGGAAPRKPPNAPGATLPKSAEPKLSDLGWGVARSARLGLKLALPERRVWLDVGHIGGGWEVRHEPTGSTLSIRRWRASRLVQVEACAAELRQRMPLPEVDETSLVARRTGKRPEGFVTRVELLVVPGKRVQGRSARLRGYVLAVGASVGECLAAVFVTESSSDTELAERLRLLDGALASLRRTTIEDRVKRAPPREE